MRGSSSTLLRKRPQIAKMIQWHVHAFLSQYAKLGASKRASAAHEQPAPVLQGLIS